MFYISLWQRYWENNTMEKDRFDRCQKYVKESNVLFLPFTGEDKDWLELSSDRTIPNKYEMKRKYPGQRYITDEFRLGDVSGYVLVSKRYLRENINGLFYAKKDELKETAENMIGVLLHKLRENKLELKKV